MYYPCVLLPYLPSTPLAPFPHPFSIVLLLLLLLLQDYLSQVVNHPVLQGSEELRLFLTQPGDLAACDRWQRMVQRPAPMDALLGLRRAEAPSSSSNPAAAGVSGSSSTASGAAVAGWGGMMRSVRHSIMSAVQPKAQPALAADEQQLRQAKESFK